MSFSDTCVVVPVYNRATTVIEALDSVASQTMLPRRLIVVDDGSTDGTAAAVRRWMQRTCMTSQMRLLVGENRGAAAARNRAVKDAGGCEFLAFLDSDDLWPFDFLERTTTALARRREAVAATTDIRYFCHANCDYPLFHKLRHCSTAAIAHNATQWLIVEAWGITPATVVRSEPFRQLGGYDERLVSGEDLNLFLNLSLLGPWLHVPGPAAQVRFGVSDSRGEEGHLQLKGAFRQCAWVGIIDDFVARHVRLTPCVSRRMASLWYCAGKELMLTGLMDKARECFWRSIGYRPLSFKAWCRLGRTLHVQTAGRRPAIDSIEPTRDPALRLFTLPRNDYAKAA